MDNRINFKINKFQKEIITLNLKGSKNPLVKAK